MYSATASLPTLKGNFVVLRAGNLQLVLPQADVGAAQYLADRPRGSAAAGMFELPGDADSAPRRVVALSAQMTPLPQLPDDRFLMTSFEAQAGVALCWDEVKVLIDVELQPQPLPAVMLPPDAPLTEFVEIDGEMVFCCTGARLLAHAFAARS